MCGSEITEKSVSKIYEDNELYFCENECLEEFNTDPTAFINSDHFLIDLEILQNSNSWKAIFKFSIISKHKLAYSLAYTQKTNLL